jgi:DNA polymerase-3 subunit beta
MATATKERKASITLDTATLRAALADVLKAVPQRGLKPILSNVLLADGLLTGTDLEVRVERHIDYHGEPMLLPAQRLAAILREARGNEVTLTPKGSSITVKCGGGSWTLPTDDAAEYPTWDTGEMKAVCRIPADQFARAAKATVYATDSQSSRYALGGVLLHVTPTDDGSKQQWVATDGRRLACVTTESDQAVDESQTLIPARVMTMAMGMAHGDGSVQVESNAKEVRFTLDECSVTARLVEGRFPPQWPESVSEPESKPSVLVVAELLTAVKSAEIVVSEHSKAITLTWTSSQLVLTGKSSEYGESRVTCAVETVGSTSGTKVNPQFLKDFLANISGDEEPSVNVFIPDASSRVLLKCGPYTGVIMPLSEDA